MKASEAIMIGHMNHSTYAKWRYGYRPPSPREFLGLNMYNAECTAIIRTATSAILILAQAIRIRGYPFLPEASMPTDRKNPLIWQNLESFATGPFAKVTIRYIISKSDLNMSL